MIKLFGANDEPDSSILYGLQTVEIVKRQTRKHRIAVIKPRENKACYEHCTCATGQTAPNATDLPQDTKTSRCKATDVTMRQCRQVAAIQNTQNVARYFNQCRLS